MPQTDRRRTNFDLMSSADIVKQGENKIASRYHVAQDSAIEQSPFTTFLY